MNIQLNRDWVKTLVVSLPDYADELGKNIESAMADVALDNIDKHSCALAAALADGNGELAFEISMSDVLRGNDIREDIAKAVINMTMYDATDNISLYALTIAHVLKNEQHIKHLTNSLFISGFAENQIAVAIKIAKLIPAVSKCLI